MYYLVFITLLTASATFLSWIILVNWDQLHILIVGKESVSITIHCSNCTNLQKSCHYNGLEKWIEKEKVTSWLSKVAIRLPFSDMDRASDRIGKSWRVSWSIKLSFTSKSLSYTFPIHELLLLQQDRAIAIKVIIEKSRGEVSLMGRDTIENVS